MYVVINIDPGTTLNELMAFMTQKTITFSVTDQLSRLCDRSVIGEKRETSTQTEEGSLEHQQPPSKKARLYNGEDYGSPCSSGTSEPNEQTTPQKNGAVNEGSNGWDHAESAVLRGLITQDITSSIAALRPLVKEEPEEESVDGEMSTAFMQNQLMQALFPKTTQVNGLNGFATLDENEQDETTAANNDLPGPFSLDGGSPASAIRYKPAYASTKRGVCRVCNREVSLITTHRRRHAITHLGFKTLKCALCYKFFSRQDLATGHFKKDHPEAEFTPFVDTMSPEDEKQLVLMMALCFPEEVSARKRKDGEPKKLKNEPVESELNTPCVADRDYPLQVENTTNIDIQL